MNALGTCGAGAVLAKESHRKLVSITFLGTLLDQSYIVCYQRIPQVVSNYLWGMITCLVEKRFQQTLKARKGIGSSFDVFVFAVKPLSSQMVTYKWMGGITGNGKE